MAASATDRHHHLGQAGHQSIEGNIKPEMVALSIGFAIYRLHPYGGLEDNCVRLAEELQRRGHNVTIFHAGQVPALSLNLVRLPRAARPRTNHERMKIFAQDAARAFAGGTFDRTVAFQTMPGTDMVFLADPIRDSASIPWWKRLTSRHRVLSKLEADCFGQQSQTRIIGLSEEQMDLFVQRYKLDPTRFRIAPPTLNGKKQRPQSRTLESRAALRGRLGIGEHESVWLSLALSPRSKGLDRSIGALSVAEGSHLLIGGLDGAEHAARPYVRQVKRLGLEHRVHWLGYLTDTALFSAMAASDVLAHPARHDVTGAVILEAIINGLPVVATRSCGFSHYIAESGAGRILDEATDAQTLSATLQEVCIDGGALSKNGIAFGKSSDLFSGVGTVCDWIENGF